ncbi:helix-turn-helix domain-containing protein [Nitrosopumilus ureiphilus]|uniref:Transposase n=1 Tax=Nitrosopumilus ureiphilus TaxID=1470067 RepID=A0A7D5R9N2_9ARCH|nr:hypothetical protein [Nitrosopumilus ureiphilus]QLH05784.1 hypothetical protein C5F50_00810 [Nitrosopumilus ureiphilus]
MRISKFTLSEKIKIVMELLVQTPVLLNCAENTESSATFYQWVKKFIEAGKASLNEISKDDGHKSLQKESSLKRIIEVDET